MAEIRGDPTDTEDFSSRMIQILNYGALNVAIGLGYNVGLFEVLDQADEPLTCSELASRANLNSRVCQEWLGIVVSGNIVDVVEDGKYFLPKHRGDVLCQRAGSDNLGVYCQEIPLLTSCVYADVERTFYTGAGIPYSKYPAFQAFMGKAAEQKHRNTLIQTFLPSIDDGQIVTRLKEGGMRVMDLGCGEGLAIALMAKEFPESTFVGLDLDEDAIAKASEAAMDISNLSFVAMDAAEIVNHEEYAGSFDYVLAFDAIHDQCEPETVLSGVYDALKPGGLFSMIDVKADSDLASNASHPLGPLLYTVSLMHCMQVGMVHGGRGLGMMWGHQKATEMLAQAGFHTIRSLPIPDDGFNLHYMAHKS